MGTTSSGIEDLAAAVLIIVAAFFFDFPAAGLDFAADFGLGFLGPAVFLVAATLGCEGASVTGLGLGLGYGVGMVLALTTHPLWRRCSSPRPDPSARQRARPAGL